MCVSSLQELLIPFLGNATGYRLLRHFAPEDVVVSIDLLALPGPVQDATAANNGTPDALVVVGPPVPVKEPVEHVRVADGVQAGQGRGDF